MPVKKSEKPDALATQARFMQRLKEAIPPGLGMAEELADILGISADSAYRRIRGETELTLEEACKLSKKYAVSLDEVFGNQNDTVTFSYTKLTDSAANFESYLNRLFSHLQALNRFDRRKIFYVAEEVPMFYSFFSKKLTDFKLFYWQRSVLNVAEYQQVKFDWGIVPQKLVDLAHNSYLEYMGIPSTEIWTSETILTVIKQVNFYFESGIITRAHALELLHEYRLMVEMVQRNAESGRKNPSDKTESYFLYNSEVVLGTNCIYAVTGESKYSYISFNSINSLTTNNPEFCDETEHWVKNLERKSTLISSVGEKQRYRFFSHMYESIDTCTQQISRY